MCKGRKGVGAMPSADLDFMLLAAVAAGGAGSALIVNQVTKAIFKNDPVKSKKWAPAIKIGLGIAALMYSDNEYVNAAGLGMIAVGGTEGLQALKPELFNPIKRGGNIAPNNPEGQGYIGETIDLNAWAVGSYGDNYDSAVAGGYPERAVAGGL